MLSGVALGVKITAQLTIPQGQLEFFLNPSEEFKV
jgi:hypothetical protein